MKSDYKDSKEAEVAVSAGKEHGDMGEGKTTRGLKWWHVAATVFMGLQAGIINASPVDIDYPSAVGYPDRSNSQGPRGEINVRKVGSVGVQSLIVTFLALAAVDHFLVAIIGFCMPQTFRRWFLEYEANPLRWIEYSVSASIMSVLIAILTGVYDVHLLFLVGVSTGICNLLGIAIELLPDLTSLNRKDYLMSSDDANTFVLGTDIVSLLRMVGVFLFSIASVSLITGWIVILFYFSQGSPPDFVYGAFIGTIIAYSTFAINMWLERFNQYYDFVKAEKIYIILSFTAKTFLAWDVYGGLKAGED